MDNSFNQITLDGGVFHTKGVSRWLNMETRKL